MVGLKNVVLYAMIPANLLVIAWVWIGRMIVGSGGWYLLIFLFSVVPVLFVALTATTVLGFTQRRPAAIGRLTGQQALAQLVVWVVLVAFGFVVVDFGDTDDSEVSGLTQVFGREYLDLSYTLQVVTAALAAAAWVWLLVVLIIGNVDAARERRAAAQAPSGSWSAAPAGDAVPYLPPVPPASPRGPVDGPPHAPPAQQPGEPPRDRPSAPPGSPPLR